MEDAEVSRARLMGLGCTLGQDFMVYNSGSTRSIVLTRTRQSAAHFRIFKHLTHLSRIPFAMLPNTTPIQSQLIRPSRHVNLVSKWRPLVHRASRWYRIRVRSHINRETSLNEIFKLLTHSLQLLLDTCYAFLPNNMPRWRIFMSTNRCNGVYSFRDQDFKMGRAEGWMHRNDLWNGEWAVLDRIDSSCFLVVV